MFEGARDRRRRVEREKKYHRTCRPTRRNGSGPLSPPLSGANHAKDLLERPRRATGRRERERRVQMIGGRPARVIRQAVRQPIGVRGPASSRQPSRKPPNHALSESLSRSRSRVSPTQVPR